MTNCSGPCITCISFKHGCLAGHGDDDYMPASLEQLLKRKQEKEELLKNDSITQYKVYFIYKDIEILDKAIKEK